MAIGSLQTDRPPPTLRPLAVCLLILGLTPLLAGCAGGAAYSAPSAGRASCDLAHLPCS
jgi:hypothetical protein